MEQGSVFRQNVDIAKTLHERLNPFGTGQCLSTEMLEWLKGFVGLNPFGTGQCLSTGSQVQTLSSKSVSIPLEQGSVFRLSFFY